VVLGIDAIRAPRETPYAGAERRMAA
jgi:hypothetical protein